jgi:Holliday junction DNA helicase RuvA
MIGYLNGKIAHLDPAMVILDVNGVGYEVYISLNTYGAIKKSENIKLYTYLHIKEDAHTLYGFSSELEKDIFLKLISISGIGPGTGIMITSSMAVDEIKAAIIHEDVQAIQRVKGIGMKTAQRVILELKDKIKKEGIDSRIIDMDRSERGSVRREALAALVTLGINKNAAEKSIDTVLKTSDGEISLEELIKQALKRA